MIFTLQEAECIRRKFFDAYKGLMRWHQQAWHRAKASAREVRTKLGRRRLLPAASSDWERFTGLVNMPVQGAAADGMKLALVELSKRLPDGAHIILTVHDEVVVECQKSLAQEVGEMVRQVMVDSMDAVRRKAAPISSAIEW